MKLMSARSSRAPRPVKSRKPEPAILVARSIEMALAAGRSRFDFLRGDEPYKYGWGARDVPIQRLLVVRTGG